MRISGEDIIGAIRATKVHISDLSNVCRSCESRDQVFLWTKATDADMKSVGDEIDKAYRLALERCYGERQLAKFREQIMFYEVMRHGQKV